MKKRIVSLILCFAMLFCSFPFSAINVGGAETVDGEFENYGKVIGNTAYFNVESTFNFLVFSDPSVFDYDADWNDDNNWLYYDTVDGIYDFAEDQLFVIENYYYDEETTALWYKLAAAPGHEMPERMKNASWAFQNYTEEYEYDDWQEYAPDALIVNDAQNFVFDADGNAVSSVTVGLYDKISLSCESSLIGDPEYQWQVLVGDEWTDVMGCDTANVTVDYSLLLNALDSDGQAKLRCVSQSGSKQVTGEPVSVIVNSDFDYDSYVHPEEPESADVQLKSVSFDTYSSDGISPLADDNVCYVTVQYLFENGSQAANSFVAQVPVGIESSVNVDFPHVQGYVPTFDGVDQSSLSLTKVFNSDELYTVEYRPTNVDYTVDIYFQNINNDDYSFYDSRTYQGLTGSNVPLNTKSFEGMRELLHETPTIAADGTTHVEVYYDRIYYMTRVYLDEGFGIYSVYARYGADLRSHLSAPTKPGFLFVGWDELTDDADADGVPETGGDRKPDTVYATVPSRNLAYLALWKEHPTSQVNIVFWGENPNDEGYSYLDTQKVYVEPGTSLTYSLSSSNICGLDEHTHTNECEISCGKTVHKHVAGCYNLSCTKEVHTHNNGCNTECDSVPHICTVECYISNSNDIPDLAENTTGNAKNKFNDLRNSLGSNAPVNGNVYKMRDVNWYYNYYIYFYINDTWYYLGTSSSPNNSNNNSLSGVQFSGLSNPNNNNTPTTVTATIRDHYHIHSDACIGCGKAEHTHTDYLGTCYTLTCTTPEHVHGVTCYNSCVEHTHSNTCRYPTFEDYDANLWTLVKSDTVTVEEDGTTVLNVYFDRTTFTLTFRANNNTVATIADKKWGSSISGEFSKAPFNTTYNGRAWQCTEESKYSYALQTLDVMPKFDATFNLYNQSSQTLKTIYYYVENVGANVSSTTWPSNANNFTLLKTVDTYFNYATYDEEYHEMVGFTRYSKDVSGFGNNQKNFSNNTLYLYYLRTSYPLEFHYGNDDDEVRNESLDYETPLSDFSSYIPPLPDEYEPGSHEFDGWYLNPDCTGERVDMNNTTMPASALALYAKWKPRYHEVRIVLEKKDDGNYTAEDSLIEVDGNKVESLSILHGTIIFAGNDDKTPPIPENGLYKFLGWFYMDDDVELMWDFEHHPIVKDTVIYAKWSSEVLVPYTVYYKDTLGNEIAPPTVSSSLAGHSITLKAKVGNDLSEAYREGYFPKVSSHSLPLNIEDAEKGTEYTFIYERAESKKYQIHYIDIDNGNAELTSPVEKTSTYAIVTETFKYFDGYVPDAFQKTLILKADENENHIYFYYTKSSDEGVWFVGHYTQSIGSTDRDDPSQYATHATDGDVDKLDTVITAEWPGDLSEDGFSFYKAVISDGETEKTVYDINEAKGAVTEKGLLIRVYYTRNKYPYKVVYKNKDTGDELGEANVYTDEHKRYYGEIVSIESYPNFAGYDYVSSSNTTIVREDDDDNVTKNIIYVYYTEQSVRLNFKVVGDDGCGSVNPDHTYVKIKSDGSATATAIANQNYVFKGWYSDEDCKYPVSSNETLILIKPTDGWIHATYYAKFEPGTADLTIDRNNADEDQVFVYAVTNTETHEVIYVTVKGNGQTTIKDLPMGEYTVTQHNGWSWRHDDPSQTVEHQNSDGTTVTFDKAKDNDSWLNGNSAPMKNERSKS